MLQCKKQDALSTQTASSESPKLVVGIVVDQMRYDYLTRFAHRFGKDGFNRLLNEGFNMKNGHYNYIPTYTGPGHASVYTGTSPMNHGIISNTWYERFSDHYVYCASDTTVTTVGSDSKLERMSPRRMKTTTVTDQLRLHTQQRAKTIGIAIKDRGAILPAGHSASGAYWFRGRDEGKWITTDYYRDALPQWVQDFNKTVEANYLKEWNTLLPIAEYTASGVDENNFERPFKSKKSATFPHDLKALMKHNRGYDVIKSSPFGNTLTVDFAMEAVKAEEMGKDDVTDFLAVSFSSTDYIGHQFGVNSVEVEDTYIRLDRDLEKFFKFLDTEVGKGAYTVFLTADHGAVNVPNYLKTLNIPAGYFDEDSFKDQLSEALKKEYGEELIKNVSNNNIFLDRAKIKAMDEDLDDVQDFIATEIIDYENIDKVYTAETLSTSQFLDGTGRLLQNGYHQKHSGDVLFILEPSVIEYGPQGSTHGSGMTYDTHVPMLFYGNGIKKGSSLKRAEIVDIAPTISSLLGIAFPNACTGKPLDEVLK